MQLKAKSFELKGGELLRVEGPARLRVNAGAVLFLGARLAQGAEVTVPSAKAYTLKALEAAEVTVSVGPEGSAKKVNAHEEVVEAWDKLSDEILERRPDTIVLLGNVDTGKSTFAMWLANKALNRSRRVVLLDTDIGQNEVGFPTTLAAISLSEATFTLPSKEPDLSLFVGHVTPVPVLESYLSCVRTLVEKSRSLGDLLIVNTDGWIRDARALSVKAKLVETINPDVVVIMKGYDVSSTVLRDALGGGWRVVMAPSPPKPRFRSRTDRRAYRERRYALALQGARALNLDLRKVKVLGRWLYRGRELEIGALDGVKRLLGLQVYYGEIHEGVLYVIASGRPRREALSRLKSALGVKEVVILRRGFEKGVLVGLLDEGHALTGLGVLLNIDYPGRRARVIARPDAAERARYMAVGFIRLAENFAEHEKLDVQPL